MRQCPLFQSVHRHATRHPVRAEEIVGNPSSSILMPVLQCGQHSAFSRRRQFSAHVSSG